MSKQLTTIKIDNKITINFPHFRSRSRMPSAYKEVERVLTNILIFRNPKFDENEKHGYSNYNTPELLNYIHKDAEENAVLPRGVIYRLITLLRVHNIKFVKIIDKTSTFPEISFKFKGEKRAYQSAAAKDILSKDFGILQAPTGGGKTTIALDVIAQRQQPALIIVHTKELLYQWRDRIVQFLEIPAEKIGLIGDGHRKVGKKITVTIINSLYKLLGKINLPIGFLIVDECHRVPARVFSDAVQYFDCRYMLGLSATPFRRDGLTDVMHFYLGGTVHTIETKTLQEKNWIMKASLEVIHTGFNYSRIRKRQEIICNDSIDHSKIISSLIKDEERNELIIEIVIRQTKKDKGIALVISDRKEHCQLLHYQLMGRKIPTLIITGDTKTVVRKHLTEELNKKNTKVKVLVATGQLIGEGFDMKSLSSIFLTTPIKYEKRVIQYVGRILRVHKGKKNAVIYDYVDNPYILRASFKNRLKAYEELGINVENYW